MKQTINFYDFERGFSDYNRKGNFSYDGLKFLFDYLEEFEDNTGEEIEFDVIALCCDYSEYTYDAIVQAYDIPDLEDLDIDDRNSAIIEWLENETSICGYDNEIVVFNSEF